MELAAIGLVPVGSYRNREHYLPQVVNREQVTPELVDILADPQTSGGLLMAVAADKRDELTRLLAAAGCDAFPIGRVVANHPGALRVD
jgi:selenide,water dikinase